jgi:hypothetical protein
MKRTGRQTQLLSLWLQRPPDKRSSNDVFVFYQELERFHSALLKRGKGDPYQQLKVDLRDRWLGQSARHR